MWLLEVNDLRICLSHKGEILGTQVGVFSLDRKNGDIFGEAAYYQLFEKPRQRLTTAWQDMNQEPCRQIGKDIRVNSDAVFNQVSELFRPHIKDIGKEGWVVVPSDMSTTQIALLYGILEHANLEPKGFLDASASAASLPNLSDKIAYVELYLHRIVITYLKRTGNELAVDYFETLSQCGYLEHIEGWLDLLADSFLDSSRFDLFVSGLTEQQAFNQLLNGNMSPDEEIQFEIEHNNVINRISLSTSELAESSESIYSSIYDECYSADEVILAGRTSELPGLIDFLKEENFKDITINHDPFTLRIHSGSIESLLPQLPTTDEVSLHKNFPIQTAQSSQVTQDEPTSTTPSNTTPATHLLENAQAHPLNENENLLVEDECIGSLSQVNGALRFTPTGTGTVRVNEVITTAETQLTAGDKLLLYNNSGISRELILINVAERG